MKCHSTYQLLILCRQRKRDHLSSTEQLVRDLEDDNARLKESLAARDQELSEVREQLASLSRGAGEEDSAVRASESAVHEGELCHSDSPSTSSCRCPSD